MYFQAAYMNDDFWKISGSMSPFVKANLTFGLIYIDKFLFIKINIILWENILFYNATFQA